MKYVVMYLICGALWIAWLLEHENFYKILGTEAYTEIVKKLKRDLFKNTGRDYSFDQLSKLLVSMLYIWWVITWPWQLLDTLVILKIKSKIKAKK